jgi:hypothetical protein
MNDMLGGIDMLSFEQCVERPRDRQVADGYYSGKKKQHTLKS